MWSLPKGPFLRYALRRAASLALAIMVEKAVKALPPASDLSLRAAMTSLTQSLLTLQKIAVLTRLIMWLRQRSVRNRPDGRVGFSIHNDR